MSTLTHLKIQNPDGSTGWIPWSVPKDIGNGCERPKVAKVATTLAEEVWELVQEAYKLQGKGVPASEAKICLAEIAKEKKEKKELAEKLQKEAMEAPLNAPVGKPEYGSPEFWKAYWEKKRAAGWVPKKDQKKSTLSKKK